MIKRYNKYKKTTLSWNDIAHNETNARALFRVLWDKMRGDEIKDQTVANLLFDQLVMFPTACPAIVAALVDIEFKPLFKKTNDYGLIYPNNFIEEINSSDPADLANAIAIARLRMLHFAHTSGAWKGVIRRVKQHNALNGCMPADIGVRTAVAIYYALNGSFLNGESAKQQYGFNSIKKKLTNTVEPNLRKYVISGFMVTSCLQDADYTFTNPIADDDTDDDKGSSITTYILWGVGLWGLKKIVLG
ncbi:MAG: hypothetical protein RLZZ292_890 [Bacteroidota bacterium]|jgi:hypothetical protein